MIMVTKEEAIKYLSDAPAEQCFWANDGHVLKNISELAGAFLQMNKDIYSYHANKEKNDFSKWIGDIIGDKKLANDLLSAKTKDSAVKKLNSRLALLKKKAE